VIEGLRPYSEMKPSGVAWLGDVPAHWDVVTLGKLGRVFKGNGGSKADEAASGVPCVRYGDLYTRHEFFIHASRSFVNAERAAAYTPIHYGDVLFAASGETIEDIGRSAANLIEGRAVCGGDVVVLRPHVGIEPKFLGYAANSSPASSQKSLVGKGFTVVHIYAGDLKRIWLTLPPPTEQDLIVRFLTRADRLIGRYIRTKQALIRLLEEQKQAIIHRAVTRGLDPRVGVKPSGVDWISEIPSHWAVEKLFRVTDPKRPIRYGIVLPGPNVEDGVPIVKGGNCEPGKLRLDRLSRTTREIDLAHPKSRLRQNDIVFAIRGGVGAAELVPAELDGANLTQDAARIAAGRGIDERWLLHALRSPSFQEQINARVLGATIRGINIRDLRRAELCVPPEHEQEAIAQYLAAALARPSSAVASTNREIALLREYRTRLIADVVTGKLDVREAAARLPVEVGAEDAEIFDAADDLDGEEADDEVTEDEAA